IVDDDTIGVDSTVCRTTGNCVGVGGSIAGSGTAGQLAVFDSPGTIASSIISQNSAGDTITVAGSLTATALQGDGSAVINVDALTLQGEGKSYFTDAGNLASGTLADARLSSNVAFYNATTANFSGALQQNGSDVCTVAGNCAGAGNGGGLTGSGGLNYVTKFDANGNLVASLLYDDGTALGIGTTAPGYLLDVQGGTGVVARFSGSVVGAQAASGNQFVTLTQAQNLIGGATGSGTKVASLNSLTDDLNITGGANLTVTPDSATGNIALSLGPNVSLLGASIEDGEVADNLTISATGTVADGALSSNVSLLGQNISSSEIVDGTIAGIDVADDSITLGTKTIGNYQSFTLAGDGVTITGVAGEGSTPTVAVDSTVCRTSGNCVGTGGAGAAIGGSGTAGQLAVFSDPGTITSSILAQSDANTDGT
ncbi:MAG TPA: hypothetical protein VFK03_03365, partial [Candidatus Saccharimonadales bacterium]|nr:hypothetical protein [Candidatus Saccharimonadales bacterium]